ncbi:septation protein SpoVG family protein [Planctomicrobium sp. SH664]|uniref:septation protein SpoVG family protein n=1 Tax=Planctomicrobium sp. SH664 TaxID=3448125 RepID=UPI003F5B1172
MEITEVRIKLMEGGQDRLLGFCSITIDKAFVVRDLKIIRGSKGPFVAMPSRKLTDRCRQCGNKNQLRAAYCSNCGRMLGENRSPKAADGRAKLYADIAHPINSECRDAIQHRVLQAFEEEILLAQQPGYICRYDDFGEFESTPDELEHWDEEAPSAAAPGRQHRWDLGPHPFRQPPHSAVDLPLRTDEFGSGIL